MSIIWTMSILILICQLPLPRAQCPSFTCTNKTLNPYDLKLCGSLENSQNNYKISFCPEQTPPLGCNDINDHLVYCSQAADHFLPGSKATNPEECRSEEVKDGLCVGARIGENCEITLDCDIGLYCSSTVESPVARCREKVDLGESCDSDMGCYAYAGCHNHVCRKFGTLLTGTALGSQNENLCQTFFKDPSTNVCTNGPVLNQSSRFVDSLTGGCKVNYDGTEVSGDDSLFLEYTTAKCGINRDHSGVCKPLWPYRQTYLKTIVEWAARVESKCPVPFGLCTMYEEESGYHDAMKAACNIFYYLDTNAPVCMQRHGDYWLDYCYKNQAFQGGEGVEFWLDFAIFTILGLVVILVILFAILKL